MNTGGGIRSTAEKIAIFRACFSGLSHAYGTYDMRTGRALQVKEPVSDKVILDHLQGRRPHGVYLLTHDRTRAAAVDFDTEDTTPPLHFLHRALDWGLCTYLERSKRRGWHVWLFADQGGVSAAKVRRLLRAILIDIGKPSTEVFPKQDRLSGDNFYGNFIFAPLFGGKVAEGRTVFVDSENCLVPYTDQWQLLAAVERVTENQLDEALEAMPSTPECRASGTSATCSASIAMDRTFGLPPCVQRMLREGVPEFQRVACFRIALHLRRAGVPHDITVAALEAWARKNRPENGQRLITPSETLGQVTGAYAKSYRGCGCEEPAVAPFCTASCPVRRAAPPEATRENERPSAGSI